MKTRKKIVQLELLQETAGKQPSHQRYSTLANSFLFGMSVQRVVDDAMVSHMCVIIISAICFYRFLVHEKYFHAQSYIFGSPRHHIRLVQSSHRSYVGETLSSQNTQGGTTFVQ